MTTTTKSYTTTAANLTSYEFGSAEEAYEDLIEHAHHLVKRIGDGLEAHQEEFDSDMNYGRVGDLCHYITQLAELADQVNQTGEYDPSNRA